MGTFVFLIILLLVLVIGGIAFAISQRNGLVQKRNSVEEAWHQIDVELTRRHDLIPNLVETVKGYARHEQETLDNVIRARGAAVNTHGSADQVAAAEGELSQALGRLISVSEAYPDLKANQNYQALMGELSASEDRLASARRYYNATVQELNTKIDSFPSNIFANQLGLKKSSYYEADEATKGAPRVNMTNSSAPSVSFDTPQSQERPYAQDPKQLPASNMPYPTQVNPQQQAGQEGYGMTYPDAKN